METLRIAIQSKGRLAEDSLGLIKDCGIQFDTESRVLKERAYNFPLEFLFVRDDDIPGYVHDGIADIGIVGRNERRAEPSVESGQGPWLRQVQTVGCRPRRF